MAPHRQSRWQRNALKLSPPIQPTPIKPMVIFLEGASSPSSRAGMNIGTVAPATICNARRLVIFREEFMNGDSLRRGRMCRFEGPHPRRSQDGYNLYCRQPPRNPLASFRVVPRIRFFAHEGSLTADTKVAITSLSQP